MYLVSIIVPIYNTEGFLDRCLRSIVSQTYKDIEIILVDDGSTDSSLGICKEYASKDYRVKLLSQPNSGASAARNNGLNHTQGDYVMFVDSDDWIEQDLVQILLDDIIAKKTDMVVSQVPLDNVIPFNMTMGKIEALPILLRGSWWSPYGKIFNKATIEGIRFPKATISEDYVFMMHAILKCERIYYDSRCFYHRETRAGSLSRLALSKRKFEEFDNVSYVAQFIRENYPQFSKLAEARMAETSLKLLLTIYKNDKIKEFKEEAQMLIGNIRNNLFHYTFNNNILLKSRLLLITCTTEFGRIMTRRLL